MVVATEIGTLADVIFAIEGTAINGAYLNDIKTNYIIPTLEYFSQSSLEDREYVCDEVFHPSSSALYGIVVYHAADRLPSPCTDIYGPYLNPQRFLQMLDKLELVGGRGESHANVAEALATSLVCFDDMQLRRDSGVSPQKHCILICNSPPYLMPVQENQLYAGNTAEQLATMFNERSVHLTILSPRKIPAMFKLYEKAGGDLSSIQTKNYAKDPRHLVLLKGFSLKERPVSPTAGNHMSPAAPCPPAPNPVGPAPVPRYPGYPQAPRQPPARWPPPGHTQYRNMPGGGTGSALIDQLIRPPSIPNQFNNATGIGLQPVPPNQQVPQNPRMILTGAQQHPGAPGMMPNQGGQGPVMMPGAPAGQPLMASGGQPGQPPIMTAAGGQMLAPGQTQPGPGIMPGAAGPGNSMMINPAGGNAQQGLMVIGPNGPIPGQMVPPQQQVPTSQGQPNPNIMPPQQVQPGMLNPQNPMMVPGQPPQQPNTMVQQQQQPMQPATQTRERQKIWQGILEWIEKAKNPNESQKLTRHVPCQVSASTKDGDGEIKADAWPKKLIMQLMPRQLIGTIGGAYLKNSKSVLFHPQACESLDALTKVMSSGYAGCVHFSGLQTCDIKVLILLYTAEKRTYLGFIPNDQGAFVDRLRKVIQQQKTTHAIMRQQSGGQPGGQPGPGMVPQGQQQIPGMVQQTPISQAQQQPNMGGQMGGGGLMGGPGGGPGNAGLPQGPGMNQNNPGINPNLQQQADANNPQSAAYDAARQENLVKIQRLRQTLEAAQQQELQYKQLEVSPHTPHTYTLSGGNLHYDGAGGGGMPGVDQGNFYPTTTQEQQLSQQEQWNQPQPGPGPGAQQQQQQPWSNKNTSNVNLLQFMNQMKMQQQMQDQTQLNQNQLEEQKLRAQLQQMQGGQPQQQRMMRPIMPNNPGLRHLLQQPQYRLPIQPQMRPGGPMQPQLQQQAQQQQQFDDSYDFLP